MTRSMLSLASTLVFLLVAAAPAGAAGPKSCHFRLVGWTPDGTGYFHHMECVGEELATGKLSKVGDENADPVDLCDSESCPTMKRAAAHPKVRALKLCPSGKAPAGLSAKATVRKGRAWTLTFTLTQGRKTIRLGTKNVGGSRWRFKEALWEPEGRAVAFSFSTEEGRDDKGEFLYVFPVPMSARPAATTRNEPAIPFGLRFGMTTDQASEHLVRQGLKPEKRVESLFLRNLKYFNLLVVCDISFSKEGLLFKVSLTHSAESAGEARKVRNDLKAELIKTFGRRTRAKGKDLIWTSSKVELTYSEEDMPTGAPGDYQRATQIDFSSPR